ncbi:B12-binding domain-containing radical SAM protein [Roseibium album]|uniref:B12-binding domain-containing radical SAM protein n=1 Tax=Roseibium album TaxID=311410 RepID=UPI0024929A42|nr:radical SAM protein [Roseibium album]
MKIALVTSPQSDPTQMHVAIPNLVAFMRANGWDKTIGRDASIGAYRYYLRPERLKQARTRVLHRFEELNARESLTTPEAKELSELAVCAGDTDILIEGVEGAVETLCSAEGFADFDRYWHTNALIERCLKLISMEHYPFRWSMFDSGVPGDKASVDGLRALVEHCDCNPFAEYFNAEILPWILAEEVDVLGISIVYSSQLVPGLALAYLAKKANPDIKTVFGGSAISRLTDAMTGTDIWLDFCDFVVYSEGESALLALAEALKAGGNDFSTVPNLRYFDCHKNIVAETPLKIEKLHNQPPPDFTDLSLNDYLSPSPVITLDVTRGCYWGKCAFCSYGVSEKILKAYRERSVASIINNIRGLKEKWGARSFLFSVDVLAPSFVKKLSEKLIEADLDIIWMGDMRLEKRIDDELCRLMYQSGCRFISCGLETASKRMQDWMDKGTDQSFAEGILQAFRRAGIGVNIQFFLGFPTETRDEAQETLDFVLSNKNSINTVGFGHFQLLGGAAVERNPERFGVTHIERGKPGNLSSRYAYETVSGMSNAEAKSMIDAAKSDLKRAYPVNRNMSLLIGAHGLLHLDQMGPDQFDDRLRTKACTGYRPAFPENVRREQCKVRVRPETHRIKLNYDLQAFLNGSSDVADKPAQDIHYPVVRGNKIPDQMLFQSALNRWCRLSPDQNRVFDLMAREPRIDELISSLDTINPDKVRSIIQALANADFIEVYH